MTRFIMSIKEAIRLVIESAVIAVGGEVLITKMPVIRIKDLAEVMIEELAVRYEQRPEDIEIEIIGTKPGEKMYEELMSTEETRRAWELERYFVVIPAYGCAHRDLEYNYSEILNKLVTNPYNSSNEDALSKNDLAKFLKENDLLEDDPTEGHHPAERFWPDAVGKP
jgi:FlaA1/EpsC-like NDP-sugar epimerase